MADNPKCHPCKLEAVSENVEVSGSEDEENDGEESNAGGARVIPRQQAGEERVIVCELLTSSSRLGGCCARSGQVGKFGGGFRMLIFDVLCNGACRPVVSSGYNVGHSDRIALIPLVTLWVRGWFLTVLAAAEASRKACQWCRGR